MSETWRAVIFLGYGICGPKKGILLHQMKFEFEMSELGELSYFLSMEFVATRKGILLCQKKYVIDILKRFHMHDCNRIATPVSRNSTINGTIILIPFFFTT